MGLKTVMETWMTTRFEIWDGKLLWKLIWKLCLKLGWNTRMEIVMEFRFDICMENYYANCDGT